MTRTASLKVGELAARTGLTVRALHHYDEIGLVSPGARTPAGHRLYGRDDVERLQQVQSLRAMGMSLDVDRDDEVSLLELCSLIEGITAMEKYFTTDQLSTLKERAEQIGKAGIENVETAWATLIPQVQAAMDRGDDPASAPVQAMAARWKELVNAFTGGDAGIMKAVKEMYANEGPRLAQMHGPVPTPAMFEFIKQAWVAATGTRASGA